MDTIDVGRKHLVTSITIPKSTGSQTTTVSLGQRILENVEVFFTPGHVGLTGFRIAYNGVTILPWAQPTLFLLGDNERLQYPTEIYVSSALTITTRNNDTVQHRLIFTFRVRELTRTELGAGPVVLPTVLV